MATTLNKITPHLWYDREAGHAAEFYVSVFPDSRIKSIATLDNTPSGQVEMVSFELCGQPFMAISAGPLFKFNESVSFMVTCDTQEEIDFYWNKLTSDGGEEGQCGWLKDKFGLSWQVVPSQMSKMLQSGGDEQKARVMKAFLKMKKMDLAALQNAYKDQSS